ncbi:hypothetical protein GC176_01080 [bacterium]|nr:hypothetical protein [bacterium]
MNDQRSRLGSVPAALALLASGGLFAFLAVSHVRYPGFLEPMEGDVLQHIQRVCRGEAIYQRPTADFIPLSYMPLYYYLAAPFYSLFGDSFAGPRLLSSLCAALSGLICCWMAWRESRSLTAGCVAGALFFSSYRIMDASLTVALPDSLLLLWLMSGFAFLACGTRRWHDVAWLVCFTLAFWTKQHGALFFGCAVLYALLFRTNQLSRKAIVAGILTGGPVLYFVLGHWLGPGFFDTTLVMPGSWDRSVASAASRTVFVLIDFVPFLALMTLFYLRQSWLAERRITPLAWLAVASLCVSAFTMMAAGSANNHFVPFIAVFCVAAAVSLRHLARNTTPRGLGRLLGVIVLAVSAMNVLVAQRFSHHPIPLFLPLVAAGALFCHLCLRWLRVADATRGVCTAGLLVAAQLATNFFDPAEYLPVSDSRLVVADFQHELSAIDGLVAWAEYGNAPVALTGRPLSRAPSMVALEDVARQRGRAQQVEAGLTPFRVWIHEADPLFVLTNGELQQTPVWDTLDVGWELVHDYGNRFAGVRQVTRRWFGGGQFPRYLYRKVSHGQAATGWRQPLETQKHSMRAGIPSVKPPRNDAHS